VLGQRLVLEVQLKCFLEVGECFIDRAALAGHLNLQATGELPVILVCHRCREPHGRKPTA
jgi:hypothetical protein